MTEKNTRDIVVDEIRLAESALAAATALLDLGIAPDAASRIYYAAFHASRALLYSVGVESRSHRALRTLLARHFVRSGRLSAERSKELAQLEALRQAGDYDSAFALGVDDLRPELEKARALVRDATNLLVTGGWLIRG